jgi:hypothetical protein
MAKHRSSGAHWYHSDRPYNSQHMELADKAFRVRPVPNGWEWSVWIGPSNGRVLHNSGVVKTLASAKRICEAK